MAAHVALLRAVNVGGKNKVPMRELAALFEAAGCSHVKTYIQSGNVVFDATAAVAKKLPDAISKAIKREFAVDVPVVLRTHDELASVVDSNPFGSTENVHVMFLADRPTAAAVSKLDPGRSPGDAFAVVGREVYLHCPNGVANTKLTTTYFDRALATTSTARNFRTVAKLIELSGTLTR